MPAYLDVHVNSIYGTSQELTVTQDEATLANPSSRHLTVNVMARKHADRHTHVVAFCSCRFL